MDGSLNGNVNRSDDKRLGKLTRRQFLGAAVGGATFLTSIFAASADAQEIQSQESRVPSSDRINGLVRSAIVHSWEKNRSLPEHLDQIIFGGEDLDAGMKAFSDGDSSIMAILGDILYPAQARGFKEVEKVAAEKMATARELNGSAQRAYTNYHREYRKFIFETILPTVRDEIANKERVGVLVEAEKAAPNEAIRERIRAIRERISITIDTLPAAERMRDAALSLARVNDALLRMRAGLGKADGR